MSEKNEKKDRILGVYENTANWQSMGNLGGDREFLNKPSVKGDSGARFLYNVDLEPFQHPLLRRFIVIDPDNLTHREMLFESSPYLRSHTTDLGFRVSAHA